MGYVTCSTRDCRVRAAAVGCSNHKRLPRPILLDVRYRRDVPARRLPTPRYRSALAGRSDGSATQRPICPSCPSHGPRPVRSDHHPRSRPDCSALFEHLGRRHADADAITFSHPVCSACAVARSKPFHSVPLRGCSLSKAMSRKSPPGAEKFHLVPYRSSSFQNRTKGIDSAYGSEGQGFESLQVHHKNLVQDEVFSFRLRTEMGGVPYACLTKIDSGSAMTLDSKPRQVSATPYP